ncbi:SixA phosphatase family protein [Woodsholea maritima]|uniref:SixA phosphatase family protein n=1 Tax=Woodsholea maritima TaxID=240237 RepID=UPI0003800384|nr:histidine phosphatase family protein [Woodsholea maritima]
MPHIILMRHAKAVDRLESDDDFDRALNERGQRQAREAGEIMRAAGITFDVALVSPALRTQQTWKAVNEVLGQDVEVQGGMSLYHASPDMLRRALDDALQTHTSLILIGHNPGIGALIHSLCGDVGQLQGLPPGWPTSAFMGFKLEGTNLSQIIARTLHHNPKAQN